jgi:hypothetical protein
VNSGKTPQPRPPRTESRGSGSQDRSSTGSQDQSSATDPLGVGLPPHGLNLPPKDHCRREGSGPRTPTTFVTVENPLPFATQPLRSERQRAYAFRCQRTLRKLLQFEHRFSSRAYGVVRGPGMARIWDQLSSHEYPCALNKAASPHGHRGILTVYL